jgi:hypothetical protein
VLAEVLRPGITECEIVAEVDRGLLKGRIFSIYFITTGQLIPIRTINRKIEKGIV